MHWIHRYQLFLFDFDGLLVDTEPLHFAAYREVCRRSGFSLQWDFPTFCRKAHAGSMSMRESLYAEFPALFSGEASWEEVYREKKEVYEQLLREGKVELMQGAKELLFALDQAGIKRCVVTNSPLKHVEIIRQSLPVLQTIPLWLTRENYQNPKPAPDGYLKAVEMLADQGDQIIGFEDSLKGLQALCAAGVQAVLISPGDSDQLAECARLHALHFTSLSLVDLTSCAATRELS